MESQRAGNVWRNLFFALVLVLVLAAAGWWALQSGLLNRYLGGGVSADTAAAAPGQLPVAETTAGTAADTTTAAEAAQAGQMPPAGRVPLAGEMPAAQPPSAAGAAEAAAATDTAGAADTVQAAGDAATIAVERTTSSVRVTVPVLGGVEGAPIWSDAGSLVAGLGSGKVAQAVARSADDGWLAVETDGGAGWVHAGQVIAYGTRRLPVSELPAAVAAKAEAAAETATVTGTVTGTETITDTAAEGAAADGESTADASGAELAATVATTGARLNVRSGPGADYPVVAKQEPGAAVTVTGRNAAGDWLLVQWGGAAGGFGWAAADYLQVEGDAASLPVSSALSDAEPLADGAAASENVAAAATAAAPFAVTGVTGVTGVTDAGAAAAGLSGTLIFRDDRGGTIWAYELASGALRALTSGSDPAISPDGSTVAFVRDGGASGLYLIGIDGSNERRIFQRVSLSSPKWSPDGQWILFARGDEIQECYEMGPNQCITYSELAARFPGGIPDTIEAPLVKKQLYHLSAVASDGSNFHDIPATLAARAPDWSAGGIVYQSAGSLQRTADSTDDANQAVLFDALNPAYYDPDWQPDGGQIVFAYKGAAQWDIYVVNPDGSGKAALTRPATTLVETLPSNVAPAYSPDGQQIVFLSNRTEGGEAGAWRLWVMDADGSNQQPLPVDVQINYNFGAEQVVSWGP
jgi:uncharacterized protein YraI